MSRSRFGLTPARAALELRRSLRPSIAIVIGIAVAIAIMLYIVVRVSPGLTTSTFTAKFAVRDATGVVKGVDEVRVLGIPAGRISKIELEGGRPVITADFDEDYGPIYRDAKAVLRPVTALQDMYLDITDPGTPKAGRLGEDEVLPAGQTTTSVNAADVLNVFRVDVRTRLQALLANLGLGLEDNGAKLRAAFEEIVPLLESANEMAKQLAASKPLTQRLVHNSAVLTEELGRSQRQLRALVRDGATTMGALQASSGDLDATLRGIPPALEELDTSFAAVQEVLGDVDAAVGSLRPVARKLSPSLASLRKLSDTASPAVRALQTPVRRLTPLVRDLEPISTRLRAAVAALEPQVSAIDKVTRNLENCETGVQGFFQWNVSMSKFGDARGAIPRGNVTAGAQSTGILGDPGEYAPKACVPGRPIGGRPATEKDGQ